MTHICFSNVDIILFSEFFYNRYVSIILLCKRLPPRHRRITIFEQNFLSLILIILSSFPLQSLRFGCRIIPIFSLFLNIQLIFHFYI